MQPFSIGSNEKGFQGFQGFRSRMDAFVHPPVESGRKIMEITDKDRRRLLTAYSVELDRVGALRRTLSPCRGPG